MKIVFLISLVILPCCRCFTLLPSRVAQHRQRLSLRLNLREHHHNRHGRVSRCFLSLNSANDDDSDFGINNNEEEKDDYVIAAPTGDNDSYVPEVDTAVAANDFVSAQMEASDTDNTNSIELQTEVSNSFLQYALSVILGRALPDARDGLKPVHRRILYSMSKLSINSNTPHRKCARVVGDVLGKYHPHGDTAVYDALVRMAQSFSTNHRLVDGHGNFGSIDNDPAAAMRYTECRLTLLSQQALLDDLVSQSSQESSAKIVSYSDNFDGTETEPDVLPAKLPILLLNGSSGIAVGMATNIPPHNLIEIMTACTEMVRARKKKVGGKISDEKLLRLVPGPDFPTGASIMGSDGAKMLYTTGNGRIVMRAIATVETTSSGSTSSAATTTTTTNKKKRKKQKKAAIVITELPYQTNKSSLLEKIANLVNEKKIEGISDLRDESDRDGIRVVIELKRDAIPQIVLNNLYIKTPLQTSFSGNFLALFTTANAPSSESDDDSDIGDEAEDDSSYSLIPERFTLRKALDHFIDFRFETIRRKSAFKYAKVYKRLQVLDGLLVALENVDEVVEIIRSSKDPATAKSLLQEKILLKMPSDDDNTSDVKNDVIAKIIKSNKDDQKDHVLDAILKLQLGQLTGLSKDRLTNEKSDLVDEKSELFSLLTIDNVVYDLMIKEFKYFIDKFGTPRKTKILIEEDGNLNEIDLISNSRSVVVVTRGGYIKRMPLKTFESQGRGTRGKSGTAGRSSNKNKAEEIDKEQNYVAHCFTCNDHDTLLMTSQRGIVYGLKAYQVPIGGRTAKGQAIPSVLPIAPDDVVTAVLPVSFNSEDKSNHQEQYVVCTTEFGYVKKTPLTAFENLSTNSKNRRGLVIATLEDGDNLKWCDLCDDSDHILIGSKKGRAARFDASKLRSTGRTSRGVRAIKLRGDDTISDMNILASAEEKSKKKTGKDNEEECLLVVTSQGYGKRVLASDFKTKARGGMGVIAAKFKNKLGKDDEDGDGGDHISCFRVVRNDDEILVITAKGIMVRQKVSEIPTQSRQATGVRVQKVDGGDEISMVSIVPKYEEQN